MGGPYKIMPSKTGNVIIHFLLITFSFPVFDIFSAKSFYTPLCRLECQSIMSSKKTAAIFQSFLDVET